VTQSLREQLIGAWTLVSYEERPLDGSPSFYPMSEQPVGIIMYTPDGYMSAQLMKPGRTPFASGLVPRDPRRIRVGSNHLYRVFRSLSRRGG
jgi:hypothetical protein